MRLLPLLIFSLLFSPMAPAQRLSPLADAPKWQELEPFQETITRAEFTRLLDEVYAPRKAAAECVAIGGSAATIKTSLAAPAEFTLRFAPAGGVKPAPHSWRAAATFGPAPQDRPLQGVKIALDPGHLGGEWARMEERFFQIGPTLPVQEGDLTLRVAELLASRLILLGAEVSLVRTGLGPVTPVRPEALRDPARLSLQERGYAQPRETYSSPADPFRGGTVQNESELLFYRISEIRHRARLVNDSLRPDLTVCLHFNAEAWGDPQNPALVERNHLHILLNGCYSAGELQKDDLRFEMLYKLLSRVFPEERAAGEAVAATLAKETGLPHYIYFTGNAVAVPGSGYLWARNLLANRLYRNPVVYLEPYVMNSREVWARVQAGDYDGQREVGGVKRGSIFREYADAVAHGLEAYFRQARGAR